MPSSDIVALAKAAVYGGNGEHTRSIILSLAAESSRNGHKIVAEQLKIIAGRTPVNSPLPDALTNKPASATLESLTLTPSIKNAAEQIVAEYKNAKKLRNNGIEPRNRLLLFGAPGNGKTSFAEALAERLRLPFYIVRYDALIDRNFGDSNKALRTVFDFVNHSPCVLFFDEFDTVATERGNDNDIGEMRRIVSFLLMLIDQMSPDVVFIAATNHEGLLDRAFWRRFQFHIDFPSPSHDELVRFIERHLSYPAISDIVSRLGAISYAEATDFCLGVRRRQIIFDTPINEAIELELKAISFTDR